MPRAAGARSVVLDLGPRTAIDAAGAVAIGKASVLLDPSTPLVLVGLDVRARGVLHAAQVLERVSLVEWWTDAVRPRAHAA